MSVTEEKIKTGEYGKFEEAMTKVDAMNTSLEESKGKIIANISSLNNDSVFQGPICDSCVEAFEKLKNALDLDVSNFNTIRGYLDKSLNNYLNADKSAITYLSIKDDKIVETTQQVQSNQGLVDSLYAQVGKRIGDFGDSPSRFNKEAWCADFVCYMLRKNGYNLEWSSWAGDDGSASIFGVLKDQGAAIHYEQYSSRFGKTPNKDYIPQAGDVCLMNVDSDKSLDHVGIVIKDNGDGTVTTIEGNTSQNGHSYNGGIVEEKIRQKSEIYGYATPVKSA